MKSQIYLLEKIKDLIVKFPVISCKYEYDIETESHLIEVSPIKAFKTNELYIDFEKSFYIDFINLFPFESLTIFNEEDGIELVDPQIFSGQYFNSSELTGLDELFKTYSGFFPKRFVTCSQTGIKINVTTVNITDSASPCIKDLQELTENLINEKAGENNYALAA